MAYIYKCASYTRLSRDDKNIDESSSIQSQKMIVSSFAKFNNLNIIKEYVDDGYSGGNFDRPAFRDMINDIETGKINCVITKDLSRLGREIYNTGKYIEEYFLEKKVRYIAINDSYDSNIGDTMLGLRLGVNDLYLRDVSKKVRSAFRVKQEKGLYLGSIPCYGYIKDPNDRHKLIIDEEAAFYVRKIFNFTLAGKGICEISRYLTKNKVPIPIVHKKETRAASVKKNDGNGVWRHQTIKEILQNQMYIGDMVQNTFSKLSYNSKKLVKNESSEYIIVENTHDAIIGKETFEKVQEILNSKKRKIKSERKLYLLSGLLKCEECKKGVSIFEKENINSTTRFTQCNTFLKNGKRGNCSSKRLNYDWLEADILKALKNLSQKILEDYDSVDFLEKLNKSLNKEVSNTELLIKKLETDKNKISSLMDNLYRDKVNGLLNESSFKTLFKTYENELDILTNKLNNYTDIKSTIIKEQNFDELEKDLKDFLKMKEPTRETISNLIDKIVINKEKEIEVYLKFRGLSGLIKE